MSAALPGVIAAHTTLPVIGVPIASGALNGVDALYSIVQMPPGIPVATVGIDNARNAALLAAAILALQDDDVRRALEKYRRQWDQ
jgi:5-(carboxyamino)imidazole ribonucleotide mutase